MLQFMCGREDTQIPRKDQYFIQISWAGGKGCSGNHNTDAESVTGQMCATMDGSRFVSRSCNGNSDASMFRMERLPAASFKGKQKGKDEVGSFRLHSKKDDSKCLSWSSGDSCASYKWASCKIKPSDTDSQVFHVSKFTDDFEDSDVFNWAGADGRAMNAAGCNGWKDGNGIAHCTDDMKQGKRWQMSVTKIPLVTFRAHLGAKNQVPAADYEFRVAALSSKQGKYSELMIAECTKYGMKPVWYASPAFSASSRLARLHYHSDCSPCCHTPAIIRATVRTM